MAWLAHLLMLFTGFIGPLIIWQVKKDDDKYAAFHGKQAMFWSLAVAVVWVALAIVMMAFTFLGLPLGLGLPCFLPLLYLGFLAYGIIGIVQTSQGKVFKYFFVADQFCKQEFAEAYPDAAAGQGQTPSQPGETM